MIFRWLATDRKEKSKSRLPTVRFDRTRLTDAVRLDLRTAIAQFEDLPLGEDGNIYKAALEAVSRGGDLHLLCQALTGVGISRGRASEIAHHLHRRAKHIMDTERSLKNGITEARWRWSGACPIEGHEDANRRRYMIAQGLVIGGGFTFPGIVLGCYCVAIPCVPGFGD